MITVCPLTEVTLKHRCFRLVVADSGHVAAVCRTGSGSLISPDFGSIEPFTHSLEIKDAVLSPGGSQLAIRDANGIAVLSTSPFEKIHQWSESFESCWFDSLSRLWTCTRWDTETVVAEVWEPESWRRIAKTKISDPYGDSHVWFRPHPNPNWVVIWIAAGQDGQCLLWACLEHDGISVMRFPNLNETTWPSFSPHGDEFLVISLAELHRYGYPRGPLHARMSELPESEEDSLGDLVYYTDARHALVTSLNDRLFLVDVENMEVEDEVAILGHEPRPIAELYPRLKGDRRLASDLAFMLPLPGARFVSVHTRSPHAEDNHDRLSIWQLPGIPK